MPRFSNRPFLATARSLQPPVPCNDPLLFVIPSEASGSAVCHSRAPLLPAHNLHQSSLNPHGNTNLAFVIPGFREVRGNCRFLHGKPGQAGQVGFAPPDFMLRLVALWTGRSGAREWHTADPLASLGMTKRRGSLQGTGGCKERAVARKEWLLNRVIFQT
jgi:hypothetical protein